MGSWSGVTTVIGCVYCALGFLDSGIVCEGEDGEETGHKELGIRYHPYPGKQIFRDKRG